MGARVENTYVKDWSGEKLSVNAQVLLGQRVRGESNRGPRARMSV